MAYTDRFPIVNNFLETRLSVDCDAGEATLYLENVEALPRILVGRDYIPLVLRDAGAVREIVYVDSVDTGSGAVVVRRGQEGTNAAAWSAGSYAYCTVTADSFQRMRVNGFAPLADGDGRPSIARTSATTVNITGDFTAQLEVGMAVRILSGETVVDPTDAELGAIHITSVGFSAGMTSVSFQNVSLPTKVDGLDLGLSVASAPMYHPDTVVVDEDTLTQTQNVLRVSEKFKSEIDARNLEQDAAIDAAQSSANAAQNSANAASQQAVVLDSTLRALIAQEVAKCLKTSGGTLTGGLEVYGSIAGKPDGTGRLTIGGGGANNGFINLYGGSSDGLPGAVQIVGMGEGGVLGILDVTSAGVSFNSNPILTSAGGTMTGAFVNATLTRNNLSGQTEIYGGTTGSNGAYIALYGQSCTEGYGGGTLLLRAANKGTITDVTIAPGMGMYVGGKEAMCIASEWNDGNGNWYIKYSNGFIMQAGRTSKRPSIGNSQWAYQADFHIPFATKNYIVEHGATSFSSDASGAHATENIATTYCYIYEATYIRSGEARWFACGY